MQKSEDFRRMLGARRMKMKRLLIAIILLSAAGIASAQQTEDHSAHMQHQKPPAAPSKLFEPFADGWNLEELENRALSQNPAIAIAAAESEAAKGSLVQSGLYPNPTVGVQLEEISQRDPEGNNHEHIFFVGEQTILLGGKRGKAKEAAQAGIELAEINAEAAKQQLLAQVRATYRQLLSPQ